jgi:hypothetical protein
MTNHWLLRIGDSVNFINSSIQNIWGIDSNQSCSKGFIKKARKGDILWFVKSRSKGLLIAVATFKSSNPRIVGPLINHSLTNQQLGWTDSSGDWDTEINYENLYNITECCIYSNILGPLTIRPYTEKCRLDLRKEYENIVRYSKVTKTMNTY